MSTKTYSVTETAELFGVSRWSIYQAIERGDLTALRFGRTTRIPKIQVDRLLDDTSPPETNGAGS
jgi:excisionase family DNA binding protein